MVSVVQFVSAIVLAIPPMMYPMKTGFLPNSSKAITSFGKVGKPSAGMKTALAPNKKIVCKGPPAQVIGGKPGHTGGKESIVGNVPLIRYWR